MARARTVAEVIAGEAVSGTPEERMADMLAIASVVANRAALLGISQEDVVANQREFNAYGKPLPAGVGKSLVAMAEEAVADVAENGPVNNATFYATPKATKNLPKGLSYEDQTSGHQFFSDPQNRAIGTALGFIEPNAYGYAQNPSNVPTPSKSGNIPPAGELANSWTINGVAPALTPTVETWSDMAAAAPVEAPVQVQQPATPAITAMADAALGGAPALAAGARVDMPTVATPSSRMGVAEPGFDNSRFDGLGTSVAADFDQGRFGDQVAAGFDPGRFAGPTIDPATNTASFVDAPAQPADIAGFSDAYSAQRGPTRGILSAEHQAMQGHVEKQLADANKALLAGNTQPTVQTNYTETVQDTPAEQAIKDQTTPATVTGQATPEQQAAGYAEAAKTMAKAGMLNIGQQPPTDLSGNLPTNFDVLGAQPAPALETVEVADQPTIADPNEALTDPATATTRTIKAPVENPMQTAADRALTGARAMDVWGGKATTGTATDGSTVSRMEDGKVGRYVPEFDHTVFSTDEGNTWSAPVKGNQLQSATTTTTPADPNSALSKSPSTTTSGLSKAASTVGNSVFSGGTAGAVMGALAGTAALGPIGGIIGGLLGNKLGGAYLGDQQPDKTPFRSILDVLAGLSSPTGVASRGTSGGMSVGRDGPAGTPGGFGPGGVSGPAGGYGSTGGVDPDGTY